MLVVPDITRSAHAATDAMRYEQRLKLLAPVLLEFDRSSQQQAAS